MGFFRELVRWTYWNDMVAPFPEVVIFLLVYLAAANTILTPGGRVYAYENISWRLLYPLLLLVGLAGARAYASAIESGEASRQLLMANLNRRRFLLEKFTALFILEFALLIVADLVYLFEYLGYWPALQFYSEWAAAPLLAFGISLLEQALLVFFLNALIALVCVGLRNTNLSLLVYLAFSLAGAYFYEVNSPLILRFIQLGYGDWGIVNQLYPAMYSLLYYGGGLSGLSAAFYVSVVFRGVGGACMLAAASLIFGRIDLD